MDDDQYRAAVAVEQDQSPPLTGNDRLVALSSALGDWSDEFNNRHHAELVNRLQPDWNLFLHQH